LEIAAVNGPRSTVVAGEPAALDAFHTALTGEGVRARKVPVDYASHTSHVERIEQELARVLAGLTPHTPLIPMYSTLDNAWLGDSTPLDASYWYRNLRHPVRFAQSTRALTAQHHRVFIEVSTHPVLTTAIQESFGTGVAASRSVAVGSLRRDDGGLRRFHTSLAELHVRGVRVDWAPVFDGAAPRRVDLPTYAFQRQHYWLKTVRPAANAEDTTVPSIEQQLEETEMPEEESITDRIAGLTAQEQTAALLELVRAEAAVVLGHPTPDAIEDDEGFFDVGFNSLTAVELRNRIAAAIGSELPVMLLFDQPTPSLLAEYLQQQLQQAAVEVG
ncbi:acyltransferase domain-containing protein, partial [Streptomyces sp. NPDC006733]|uniref:acyltransferase domain-containing protein n=1 Tax=Streptomyces sp. NPDC006733 TaxID=3155460 RepID=UPI0033D0AB8F